MVRSTPKAMALGAKIRTERETRSMTQRNLARKLGLDSGTMSRIETGERPPTAELAAAILGALGVTGERREEILTLARGDNTSGTAWVAVGMPEQRTQLDALLQLEQLAGVVVDVNPLVIPGLLQSSGYTRAVMRAARVPDNEIETRVAIRMGRREILTRPNPIKFTALISANVLRQSVGGPDVMADQLDHLLGMARLDNVELRAFPVETDWHDGLYGPFTVLTIAAGRSVVHLENRVSGLFIQDDHDVADFEDAARRVRDMSMSEEATIDLIEHEARRMKKGTE
ncbi:helix-turn-helix transcriptional regulator [Saccharothrix violaceirubra]|uniref:Transcriptional regulator with XRE-family HTH domain n=1 Tax=Saccharothrix violaceirubra TaxID=413306 RepID=A0A7W7T0T5_9PSEU|nr:helix-turn-helix transcriptional regulator [Saccharothrix violaceirubra]MBB4964507.1 transcriptional regulator with XRE-family HTH domain [Saccharothrix violaceirubra]